MAHLKDPFANDGKEQFKKKSRTFFQPIVFMVTICMVVFIVDHTVRWRSVDREDCNDIKCSNECRIQLVESIPEGLNYSDKYPKYMSTFDAWNYLLSAANKTINIGSFYWTLRGSDVYNHSSAASGEVIFKKIIDSSINRKINIRIAQSVPNKNYPDEDTAMLSEMGAATVRSVNFSRLLGGGVLHTKLWVADEKHLYLGSANLDWRALTQVKELGILITNCSCLAKDVLKIFESYWFLGQNESTVPKHWPSIYSTNINLESPAEVNFNNSGKFLTYFSSSPPPLSSTGRTQDLEAIVKTILHAKHFVYISVMDYIPLMLYTSKITYWPYIDDAIRKAAIENKIRVKMLISHWDHSQPAETFFLRSLESISQSFKGVDIQIRRFKVPRTKDQEKIPFARVNHNKYMVTDKCAYIGTSNWSGDYFTNTAGIGLVLRDTPGNNATSNIRKNLVGIFERDWDSPYASALV